MFSQLICARLLVAVAAVVTMWAQPVPVTFNGPHRYPAGPDPAVAAIADFNHDGKPDIAAATSDGVAILLNKGDGFAAAATYAVAGGAKSIAMADFNHDGNTDIAAVAGTAFVYILLGNADGTFQPAQQIALPSAALWVVAGDFNGDGIPDLALAAGQVLILPGDGHGGFGPPIATTTKPGAAVLAAGDFNNDGKLDLAVDVQYAAGHDNYGLVTLLGNGDGTFQPPLTVLPARTSSGVMLVSDVTGDGIPDIVFPWEILVGNGNGTFTTGIQFSTDGSPVYPAVADVNGDGYQDILTADKIGTVAISLNSAGNVFQPAYSYVAADSLRWIGTANFLGHGNQDISLIAGSDIALIPGGRGGKYQAQPLIEYPASALNNPVMADFNVDGHLDAAVLAYGGGVSILLGNGLGGFTALPPAATGGANPSAMVAGDFNGDGIPDLAVADGLSGNIQILLGKGDGTFSNGASFAAPAGCSGTTDCYLMATTDLNADGKLDLVVLGGNSNISSSATAAAFLGHGDGTFGALLPIASGLEFRQFAVGDFNGDGHTDVVLSNLANGPLLFLGKGDGTFQAPIALYNEGPSLIVAGDFNGDGKLDLAFTNVQSQLVVVLGNGDGTFAQSQVINQFYGVPMVGDFNGDGYPDLLGVGDFNKGLFVYLGNGNGTFTQQKGAPFSCVSINWCGVALGDVRGNGKLDIFAVAIGNDYVSTPVTVLINTTRP